MSVAIRTLSDQVIEIVRERVLAGQMPLDTPIHQDALAAELGISKIPLREALARLEQDGLLASQRNRGFFVRPMNIRELEEIFTLRIKLEPDALIAGSLAADGLQRKRAQLALAAFKEHDRGNSVRAGTLNRAFHVALIEPSGDRITNDFVARLHVLADRYVGKHLEPQGRNARADKEHDDLLAAWLDHDVGTLRTLIKAHIRNTLLDLRSQLASDD